MTRQEKAVRLDVAYQILTDIHVAACKERDYKNALELYEALKRIMLLSQRYKDEYPELGPVECVHRARRL